MEAVVASYTSADMYQITRSRIAECSTRHNEWIHSMSEYVSPIYSYYKSSCPWPRSQAHDILQAASIVTCTKQNVRTVPNLTCSSFSFLGRAWDWATRYVGYCLASCTSPRWQMMMMMMMMMMTNVMQSVKWLARETEGLGENLTQCLFAHSKPHMTLAGLEPGDYLLSCGTASRVKWLRSPWSHWTERRQFHAPPRAMCYGVVAHLIRM
jgi:hypothetical protein